MEKMVLCVILINLLALFQIWSNSVELVLANDIYHDNTCTSCTSGLIVGSSSTNARVQLINLNVDPDTAYDETSHEFTGSFDTTSSSLFYVVYAGDSGGVVSYYNTFKHSFNAATGTFLNQSQTKQIRGCLSY
jgi:hypothetical protein